MSLPKSRRPGERLFGLILISLSLFLLWQSYLISGLESLSSPGALPLATATVMLFTSCFIFIKTLSLPLEISSRFFYHCFPPVVAISMAVILLYAVMLESAGFLISTFIFLLVGIKALYRPTTIKAVIITSFSLILVYILFRLIFQIMLPEGVVPEGEILYAIESFWSAN